MLAALAGLAGLFMMNPPRKRRKARKHRRMHRRNPSDIRSGKPRAARAPSYLDSTGRLWCVIGTNYGYLHTTGGDIRTWKTRSGAARAARRYISIWRNPRRMRRNARPGENEIPTVKIVRKPGRNPKRRKSRRNPYTTGDANIANMIGMRGNPGKKRRGKGVSPSSAAARLAKWRWHHNPLRPGTEGYEIPKGYKSRAGTRLGQEIRRGENPVYAFDVALIVAKQNGDHVAFKTLTADRKLLMQCKNLTQGEHVAKTTARDLGYTGKF